MEAVISEKPKAAIDPKLVVLRTSKGEWKSQTESICEFVYSTVDFTQYQNSYMYNGRFKSTGQSAGFKIYVYPTNNCQVTSFSSLNAVFSALFERSWYSEGKTIDINTKQAIECFKILMMECQNAVISGGYNFKQIIFDLNQEYTKYLGIDYLNIPEQFYVFKNDYISTNGSAMQMSLIKIEELIKYWRDEEMAELSKITL